MALMSLVILLFTVVGVGMVMYGWSMSGKMAGLIIMIVGVILLLTALLVYNKPFEDPKTRK